MCAYTQDIEELGVGLLALVRQAGGFPHVAHNGALMSASGSAMIAPPAGKGEMPGMWEWGFLNVCVWVCVCVCVCVCTLHTLPTMEFR